MRQTHTVRPHQFDFMFRRPWDKNHNHITQQPCVSQFSRNCSWPEAKRSFSCFIVGYQGSIFWRSAALISWSNKLVQCRTVNFLAYIPTLSQPSIRPRLIRLWPDDEMHTNTTNNFYENQIQIDSELNWVTEMRISHHRAVATKFWVIR